MSIIYKRLNFNIKMIIDKKLLIRNTKGQAEQIENDLFKYMLYKQLNKHLIKKEHTNKFLKWFCFEVIDKYIISFYRFKNRIINNEMKDCYFEDIIEKIEDSLIHYISHNLSINKISNKFNLDIPIYKDSNGDYIFIKEHILIIENFINKNLIV